MIIRLLSSSFSALPSSASKDMVVQSSKSFRSDPLRLETWQSLFLSSNIFVVTSKCLQRLCYHVIVSALLDGSLKHSVSVFVNSIVNEEIKAGGQLFNKYITDWLVWLSPKDNVSFGQHILFCSPGSFTVISTLTDRKYCVKLSPL